MVFTKNLSACGDLQDNASVDYNACAPCIQLCRLCTWMCVNAAATVGKCFRKQSPLTAAAEHKLQTATNRRQVVNLKAALGHFMNLRKCLSANLHITSARSRRGLRTLTTSTSAAELDEPFDCSNHVPCSIQLYDETFTGCSTRVESSLKQQNLACWAMGKGCPQSQQTSGTGHSC